MSGKRTRSFRIAVQHRDREELLRERERALFHSMVAKIAHHFLADDRDRKYYADRYTCCPPPLFVLLVTLVEVRDGRNGYTNIIWEKALDRASCRFLFGGVEIRNSTT